MIYYKLTDYTTVLTENNPSVSDISNNKIIIVVGIDYKKWCYLKCPYGCGDILTLSLMKTHKPHWKIKIDRLNRTTLYPSIRKKDGCKSHFWIKKGKVKWVLWD